MCCNNNKKRYYYLCIGVPYFDVEITFCLYVLHFVWFFPSRAFANDTMSLATSLVIKFYHNSHFVGSLQTNGQWVILQCETRLNKHTHAQLCLIWTVWLEIMESNVNLDEILNTNEAVTFSFYGDILREATVVLSFFAVGKMGSIDPIHIDVILRSHKSISLSYPSLMCVCVLVRDLVFQSANRKFLQHVIVSITIHWFQFYKCSHIIYFLLSFHSIARLSFHNGEHIFNAHIYAIAIFFRVSCVFNYVMYPSQISYWK